MTNGHSKNLFNVNIQLEYHWLIKKNYGGTHGSTTKQLFHSYNIIFSCHHYCWIRNSTLLCISLMKWPTINDILLLGCQRTVSVSCWIWRCHILMWGLIKQCFTDDWNWNLAFYSSEIVFRFSGSGEHFMDSHTSLCVMHTAIPPLLCLLRLLPVVFSWLLLCFLQSSRSVWFMYTVLSPLVPAAILCLNGMLMRMDSIISLTGLYSLESLKSPWKKESRMIQL